MPKAGDEPVIVVGAGIAGLTCALALKRRGVEPLVIERVRDLVEVGAGLQIAPNGSRVLIHLGLEERLERLVAEIDGKQIRLWSTGQAWTLFDLALVARERYGAPYWMVHRGDLHQALRAATQDAGIEVRAGVAAAGYEQAGEGAILKLADGESLRARAVVGADGIHSRLRTQLAGQDRAAFTGIMAWRGIARAADLPEHMRAQVGTNWVGPHRHVVTYPIRGGELVNFVGVVERDDWRVESWTERGTLDECLRDFEGWHADVHSLIRAVDAHYRWALLSRPPLEHCAEGGVVLIGDACHPTLPFLAQGANMALEDAEVVARCLARYPTPTEAFRAFQAMRLARTAEIVRKSADQAARFHNPAYDAADTAAAIIDAEWEPARVAERYEWLFRYDAMTAPLPDVA